MSISTGAPSAFARALGFHEDRNGTAAKATPTAPVSVVAAVRSWRRPLSIDSVIDRFSFVGGIDALYTAVHGRTGGGRADVGHAGLAALDLSLDRARSRGRARVRAAAARAGTGRVGADAAARARTGAGTAAAARARDRVRELRRRRRRDGTRGGQHLH